MADPDRRLSDAHQQDADATMTSPPAPDADARRASGAGPETPDALKYRARACARCSRSKLRCNRRTEPGAEPCVRCARLGVECTLPEAKPRGPKRGQARRVGQLEQKLDGIMSLLTASQQLLTHSNTGSPTALTQSHQMSPAPDSRVPDDHSHAAGPGPIGVNKPAPPPPQQQPLPAPYFLNRQDLVPATPDRISNRAVPSPVASSNCRMQAESAPSVASMTDTERPIEIWPGFELKPSEAATVLESYAAIYAPNFPFVPIPAQVRPIDLFASHPFLFRTIMLVAAPQSPPVQRAGERWFRSYVAEHVVALGEKRLELLQALIMFVAYGDYRFYMESKATQFLQMAIGLVLDLGLNKVPLSVSNLAPFSLLNEALRRHPHLRGKSAHSSDDMRAMLGCFYLTSLVTNMFRREHHIPYTDFIDKCCSELASAEEFATDVTLVTMVRMQCLVRRAHSVLAGASPEPGVNACFTAPAAVALAAIRRELDETMANYRLQDERTKAFLRLHYHACMVATHEPVIYARAAPPLHNPLDLVKALGAHGHEHLGAKRTDALWRCLEAIADFIQCYVEIPIERIGAMAIFPGANLAFCFVTVTRLLFLDDGDWDGAAARRSFDFPALSQRIIDRYAAADAFENEGGSTATGRGTIPYRRRFHEDGSSLLGHYVLKTRWLTQWYMARTAPAGANMPLPEPPAATPGRPNLFDLLAPQPHQQEQQQQRPHQQQQVQGGPSMRYHQPHQQQQQMGVPASGDPIVGFDATSFVEDFDDSFWHAFLSVDSQVAYPPMLSVRE